MRGEDPGQPLKKPKPYKYAGFAGELDPEELDSPEIWYSGFNLDLEGCFDDLFVPVSAGFVATSH